MCVLSWFISKWNHLSFSKSRLLVAVYAQIVMIFTIFFVLSLIIVGHFSHIILSNSSKPGPLPLVSFQNPGKLSSHGKTSFISHDHQSVIHSLVYHKCHKSYIINKWQYSELTKPCFQKKILWFINCGITAYHWKKIVESWHRDMGASTFSNFHR